MSDANKQVINCLKFIASCAKQGVHISKSSNEAVLINAKNQRRSFPNSLIQKLVSSGSARNDNLDCLQITADGQAKLKRLICNEDAHATQHRNMAQAAIKDEAGELQSLMVNMSESPLAWLYQRKDTKGKRLLDETQFKAGERLRADYEKGHLRQRISANWEAALSGGKRGASKGGQDIQDAALDARSRVDQALSVIGDDMAGLLIDVCCHLKGLKQVETERKWPQRSAKIVLSIALNQLAEHYGLSGRATLTRSHRIHAWGDGSRRELS